MRLWGGRFNKEPTEAAFQFGASLHYDRRLWEHDLRGSIAHARMLGKCGIIPDADAIQIVAGLEKIRIELSEALAQGEDPFDYSSEDIHTEIERLLTDKIGDAAGRLHTARSRNDQIALDMRLYVRDACDQVTALLVSLQQALLSQADQHLEHASTDNADGSQRSTLNAERSTVLPGYTHKQHAQPVLLSHHLLAHFWKLQRDRARFADCRGRANISPLGAGPLAGTSFPIDPAMVAQELGFAGTFDNSMDAVSDRDFVAEFLAAAALCATHLSSLAGELVQWSAPEFGFVSLDDAWCTGSSIMPQKRNPDMAELTHGKTARIIGHVTAILSLLKGLSLTYNRDLQEDKEALFDADDTLRTSLVVMAGMIASAVFLPDKMQAAVAQSPFVAATELADYLAKKSLPFRAAHGVVGAIVRYCEEKKKMLQELTIAELQPFSPLFAADVLDLLAPDRVSAAKTSPGGTAPARVREQLEKAKQICMSR
jgi:argininosuccinate lyase